MQAHNTLCSDISFENPGVLVASGLIFIPGVFLNLLFVFYLEALSKKFWPLLSSLPTLILLLMSE